MKQLSICILLTLLSFQLLAQSGNLPRLPSGPEGPGEFGAYYTHLKYDPEWDADWRVGDHPDIVVQFEDGGHKFVFWRGTSYIPAWVTSNGIWYTNEFVERRDSHSPNTNSIVEPMSDKQCRYSQVRIIESNPARVIIHWRYAPVDVTYEHPFIDQETGWFDWVDEYYTIYPDASGVRKITAQSSGLNKWMEFQESIVINQPGTLPHENIESGAVSVANMDGQHITYFWDENGGPAFDENPPLANILRINLKSDLKPYALVAPPQEFNNLITSYQGHGRNSIFNWWDHWPVSQDALDGRGARSAARPSHSSLAHIDLPIDPPVDSWGSYGYDNVINDGRLELTFTEWGGLNIDMRKYVDLSKPFELSFDYADLYTEDVSLTFYTGGGAIEDINLTDLNPELELNNSVFQSFSKTIDLSKWAEEADLSRVREFYLDFSGSENPETVKLDNIKLEGADGTVHYFLDFEKPDGTIIETLNLPEKAKWEAYKLDPPKITKLMLHGMTDLPVQDLVPLARSWDSPSELTVKSDGYESAGYDPTQMAYIVAVKESNKHLKIQLNASKQSPVVNPVFVLKNWGETPPSLNINGTAMINGVKLGIEKKLDRTDMVVWVKTVSDEPLEIFFYNPKSNE